MLRAFTERLAWTAATIGSALLIPIGTVRGTAQFCSGHFAQGLKTIKYSWLMGIKFTLISAPSIAVPSIGTAQVKNSLINANEMYNTHSIDGFSMLDPMKYPPEKFQITPLNVVTNKGKLDAIEVSPANSSTEKILIKLCGAGHNYQEVAEYIVDDVLKLNCKVIVANYPGVTTQRYEARSFTDYVNVGVALLNYVKSSNYWSFKQVAQNTLLEGYSFGGRVARAVAAHYANECGTEIPFFVNRSPRDLSMTAAAIYNASPANTPFWYMKKLHDVFFYASGNLNSSSIKYNKFPDREKFDYLNVKNDAAVPEGTGFADSIEERKTENHYFKWEGSNAPIQHKSLDLAAAHRAPNHTLVHPDTGITAETYFRLFARKVWGQATEKKVENQTYNSSLKP